MAQILSGIAGRDNIQLICHNAKEYFKDTKLSTRYLPTLYYNTNVAHMYTFPDLWAACMEIIGILNIPRKYVAIARRVGKGDGLYIYV